MLRQSLHTLMARRLVVAPVAAVAVLAAGVGGRAAITSRTTDATPTPASTATASPAAQGGATPTPIPGLIAAQGGGAHNVVDVRNHQDGVVRADGKVQVTAVHAHDVEPTNSALAYSSCQHCDTVAVALQIALVDRNAPVVTPHNSAVAVNYRCTGCVTVAVAYQYLIPVDDPDSPSPEVRRLVSEMNGELAHLRGGHTTLAQAIDEVNAVIAGYGDLASYLSRQQDQTSDDTSPGATAAPDTSPSPADSASAAPSGSSTTTDSGAGTTSSTTSTPATSTGGATTSGSSTSSTST